MRKKTAPPQAQEQAAPPKPPMPARPRFPRELEGGGMMDLNDIETAIIEAYREAVQAYGEDWEAHYKWSFWDAFRSAVDWHLEGRPIKDVSMMMDNRPLSLAAAVATAAALRDYVADELQRDAETALELARTAARE